MNQIFLNYYFYYPNTQLILFRWDYYLKIKHRLTRQVLRIILITVKASLIQIIHLSKHTKVKKLY